MLYKLYISAIQSNKGQIYYYINNEVLYWKLPNTHYLMTNHYIINTRVFRYLNRRYANE